MPEIVGSRGCCKMRDPERQMDKTICAICNGQHAEPTQCVLVDLPPIHMAPSTMSKGHRMLPEAEDIKYGFTPENGRKEANQELMQATRVPLSSLELGLEYGYVIPENFALVWKGVYRSSFPKEESFEFIKRLGLKSILTLFPEEYPSKNVKFMKEVGIHHFQIGMPGNKEPFVNIPKEGVCAALKTVLDQRNHPILIHCNKGKHRTGCVVGCLRKIQKWGLTLIFDEYRRYSHPKSRALDQQFIELFEDEEVKETARQNGWLPKHHTEC